MIPRVCSCCQSENASVGTTRASVLFLGGLLLVWQQFFKGDQKHPTYFFLEISFHKMWVVHGNVSSLILKAKFFGRILWFCSSFYTT